MLHATNLRIPIVEVEGGSLTALAGFDGHQGVALVVEPRRFASLDDVLARAAERGEPPFILVLDSLEDPHNVGTLLRSAEAAGVHGVLFPTHRQAPLSPSAVKASAGAIEHLLLCPVDDLPGALSDLHTRGVRVAGAEGDAPMTARESDLRGPLAIVVGSEGQGLGPAVRRRCDLFMRIPMKGVVGSLNAAVAGSILLFEALAQRDPNATPVDAPGAVDLNGRDDRCAGRGRTPGSRPEAQGTTAARGAAGGDRRGASEPAAPKQRSRAKASSAESAPSDDAAPAKRRRTAPADVGRDDADRRCRATQAPPQDRRPKRPRRRPRGRRHRRRPAPADGAVKPRHQAQAALQGRLTLAAGSRRPTLDPSGRPAISFPGAEGSSAVRPCPSRRRSSIGRAAVL